MRVKINVPESLSEIKLRDYQKYLKIERDNEENGQFLRQKAIELFCNVPGSVVLKMKNGDFKNISNHLFSLLVQKTDLVTTFKIGEVEYGFIPNLDRDMEFGEYIDIDEYLKDTDDLHKTMGVLYRPITKNKWGKYQIEEYEANKYDEAMLDAPMDVVVGALLFFYRLGSQLLSVTPKCLERAVERNRKALGSDINGGGTNTYTKSLEDSCSTLRRLLRSNLERHCFSLRTIGT